jgi:hypothetical protein
MRIFLLLVLLTAIVLSGCENPNNNTNKNQNGNANRPLDFNPPVAIKPDGPPTPGFVSCNPYYPLVPGSVAKYVLNYTSAVVADVTVVVDASDENGRKGFRERTQIVDRSGGAEINQLTERHFVCEGDKVIILSEKAESKIQGKPSVAENNYRPNSYWMIEPSTLAQKDANWTLVFKQTFHSPDQPNAEGDKPVVVTFTVRGEEMVQLPVGKLKALKIERKVGDKLIYEWFVRGMGMVRRIGADGTGQELKEYSGMKPLDGFIK